MLSAQWNGGGSLQRAHEEMQGQMVSFRDSARRSYQGVRWWCITSASRVVGRSSGSMQVREVSARDRARGLGIPKERPKDQVWELGTRQNL